MNARESKAAVVIVIGTPWNAFGTLSLPSSFDLIPEKMIIARRNPTPAPKALINDNPYPYPKSMLLIHTPSTAQFVVIRGRSCKDRG